MTSTICPQSLHSCAPLASVGSVASADGRSGALGWLSGVGQFLQRHAARLWGSGSATPTSDVLDAVDVPSFHR